MKILSIDVGMKNLAYCMFYIQQNNNKSNNKDNIINNHYEICQWDVIDICSSDNTPSSSFNCCATLKKKRKKKKEKKDEKHEKHEKHENNMICNKKAKYCKNNNYYCKTHAKQQPFIIPTKDFSVEKTTLSKLKRKNTNELYKMMNGYNIQYMKSMKKIDMANAVYDFIQTNVFQLVSKTTVKASQVDLITIGKNMMDKFNILLDGHEIDYVLIENQISPIANRMKTLQGMITQYFIMKHVPRIEFISAANKLKYFVNKKTTYDERKKLGIEITKNILQKNIFKNQWMEILDKSKKKDDLADSLLQGLWYMITKQMIDKKLLQ